VNAELLLWLASIAGAALFLGAGVLIGRGAQARALAAASSELERTLEGGEERDERLSAARTENEHLKAEMLRTESDLRRQAADIARLTGELAERKRQQEATRGELAAAKEQGLSARHDKVRLEAAADRHRTAETALREALARAEDQQGELEARARKVRELEAALESLKIEQLRWQERERQLEQAHKAAAVDPEVEKTLRHDLAVARETGRTLEEQRQRLEESNAQLRGQLETMTARVAGLTALERENADLRIRAMAGDLAARVAVQGKDRRSSAADAALGGQAFQHLVEQVGGLDPVRSAVVADELGLVVACHGTHGEELAAIGALFARSGSEARKVLPLDQLQRVIVEDERNISVTVRPLRSTDAGTSDSELTLVTLAVGAEPDPGQMARILHGGSNGVATAIQVES
jgi:hypothetical protein